MMELVLTRNTYGQNETMGEMPVNGVKLFTIEQPWKDNLKGHSCVPDGTYDLVPYYSNKHQCWTWCLHNAALGIFATDTMIPEYAEANGRAECELHSATWAFQLEGCVAPGLAHGNILVTPEWSETYAGQTLPGVLQSKSAIKVLVQALAPDGEIENAHGHTLQIRPLDGLNGTKDYIYEPK